MTTPSDTAPTDVEAALRLEVETFQALDATLAAEAEALARADPEALVLVTGRKGEHVELLQRLAHARSATLARLCAPAGMSGIEQWLGQAADPLSARTLWQSLKVLAAGVAARNAMNGRIARRAQQHFDAAFSVLMQAAGAAPMYGADGRPQAPAASSTRISA